MAYVCNYEIQRAGTMRIIRQYYFVGETEKDMKTNQEEWKEINPSVRAE